MTKDRTKEKKIKIFAAMCVRSFQYNILLVTCKKTQNMYTILRDLKLLYTDTKRNCKEAK